MNKEKITLEEQQIKAEENDITTIGCENHLQKRNRLKGIAMQKLILEVIDRKKEDISLKKILKLVTEKEPEYYYVQSPFKTRNKIFNLKYEFVNVNEFEEDLEIYVREKIINRKWKICSNCGQYILAEKQKTRKCRKCKKGFFRFKTKVFEDWQLEYKGKRKEVLKKLCEDKYIKKIGLNKRADFFHYANGIFYIYESKNKELSGLSFRDLITTLIYPLLLKDCGYKVSKLKIIFNGFFNEDLSLAIEKGYAKKFDFEIEFSPVKTFLEKRGLNVEKIEVIQRKNNYDYNIVHGKTNQIKIDIQLNPQKSIMEGIT